MDQLGCQPKLAHRQKLSSLIVPAGHCFTNVKYSTLQVKPHYRVLRHMSCSNSVIIWWICPCPIALMLLPIHRTGRLNSIIAAYRQSIKANNVHRLEETIELPEHNDQSPHLKHLTQNTDLKPGRRRVSEKALHGRTALIPSCAPHRNRKNGRGNRISNKTRVLKSYETMKAMT